MRQASLHLFARPRVIKVDVHRENHQHGVFCPPGLGFGSQNEILERPRAQRREPGIDPFRVGFDDRPFLVCRGLEYRPGAAAETVESKALVHIHGDTTNQLRQLTGSLAPNQVHLEEAVLCVCKTRRKRKVAASARRDDRDAVGIAANTCSGTYTGNGDLPVDLWQACPNGQRPREDSDGENQRDADKESS